MKRIYLAIIIALCLAGNAACEEKIPLIKDVRGEIFNDHAQIIIEANCDIDYLDYVLVNPTRIVIDPVGKVYSDLKEVIMFNQGPVKKVSIVKAKNEPGATGSFYSLDFIVIELADNQNYKVRKDVVQESIVVEVGQPGKDVSAGQPASVTPAGQKKIGVSKLISEASEEDDEPAELPETKVVVTESPTPVSGKMAPGELPESKMITTGSAASAELPGAQVMVNKQITPVMVKAPAIVKAPPAPAYSAVKQETVIPLPAVPASDAAKPAKEPQEVVSLEEINVTRPTPQPPQPQRPLPLPQLQQKAVPLEPAQEKVQAVIPLPTASEPEPSSVKLTYKIGEADSLDISVWQHPELDKRVVVRPDGNISFPLAGDIRAAGLTPPQLSSAIRENLSRLIKDPQVAVIVLGFGSKNIFVLGEVNRPGIYPYRGGMNVMDAVSVAEGWKISAVLNSVMLVRKVFTDAPETHRLNVYSIFKDGDFSQNLTLEPGDIIYVPKSFVANIGSFLDNIRAGVVGNINANKTIN